MVWIQSPLPKITKKKGETVRQPVRIPYNPADPFWAEYYFYGFEYRKGDYPIDKKHVVTVKGKKYYMPPNIPVFSPIDGYLLNILKNNSSPNVGYQINIVDNKTNPETRIIMDTIINPWADVHKPIKKGDLIGEIGSPTKTSLFHVLNFSCQKFINGGWVSTQVSFNGYPGIWEYGHHIPGGEKPEPPIPGVEKKSSSSGGIGAAAIILIVLAALMMKK